jgi:phosphatidylinositol alpha-mannosyltransferase
VRIALLQPTYWPEVTRGSERIVHDLATLLAERGHEVTLITTHPGPAATTIEDGFRVVRARRAPRLQRLRWYEDHVANAPNVIVRLLRGRFDVAAAFHNADAWAAVKARRLGGPPVVFNHHGLPTRRYLVERRYRVEMMRAAIAGAGATTVLSEAAARAVRRYLGCEPLVLPAGVFADRYAVASPAPSAPTLLCGASLGDPRKRAGLLFGAFARLRERVPEARLLLARARDPMLSPRAVELPEGAEWVEPGPAEDMAAAYAGATATVLPAVGEAQGMVLLESLAAGTPAVAARSGACPEILDSEQVGVLFEPDAEPALAAALEKGLRLGRRRGTVAACRARAADYDWQRLIGGHERTYAAVAASRSTPRAAG